MFSPKKLFTKLWDDPVGSKVIAGIILAILAATWAAAHFEWWSTLVATWRVPLWLLGTLVLGNLLLIYLAWKGQRRHTPRWFTWKDLDWQLLGEFFVEGYRLKPELAGNLDVYIRGPFCRNPACKREVPIVEVEHPSSVFHSLVVCPCNGTQIVICFNGDISGMSEKQAVLVEACKEAQAASRRGERFRAFQ